MSDPSQPWFESGHRNLKAADSLYEKQQWAESSFHAQQAVEIALKAAIILRNQTPPRTHSITDLLAIQDPPVRDALAHIADQLCDLEQYYTAARYPDAIVNSLPGQQEADAALDAAREAVTIIEQLIRPPNSRISPA